MINLNYQDIVNKIKEVKGLSDEEIRTKVNDKIFQLGDLISESGAAHIVANELGVRLYDLKKKRFKIKDLVAGISSIDIVGKILNIYGIREFTRNETVGRVGSMLIGDETGTVRVVVWDTNQLKMMEKAEEGSVIRVKNAYVKENNNFKELHVGNKGGLELNVDEEIGEVKFSSVIRKNEPKKISELKEGDFASLNGYIVQLFEPRFYDACPDCNRKVVDSRCEQHGEVESQKNAILNFYLDDGSGNVRVVAFRDNVKKLVPDPENGNFEEYKQNIIGNLISIDGKANKNQMFDRIEFVANNIQEFDIDAKIEELMKQTEKGS